MRFTRLLVGLVLIASLALNVILYTRFRNRRPIMTINNEGYSKKDLDDWLEQQAGPEAKALMAQRILVRQAAKKAGVLPTKADIDEIIAEQRELNWQVAQQLTNSPWKEPEMRSKIEQELAVQRLRAKEVTVTDEEIKDEYNANPGLYDTPNKAQVQMAVITNASRYNEIMELLKRGENEGKQVSPAVIMQQYQGAVMFLGDKNIYTFTQAYGTQMNKAIFDMKKGEVKQVPVGQADAQRGVKAIVIRKVENVKGKKADINDPKIKDRIRLRVAAKRAKPWAEMFRTLWDDMEFTSEDENDKKYIEMVLFPERARALENK